jgi:hypothetical protein
MKKAWAPEHCWVEGIQSRLFCMIVKIEYDWLNNSVYTYVCNLILTKALVQILFSNHSPLGGVILAG